MTTPIDSTLRDLNDCGCCEGTGPSVPRGVYNRPGLTTVAYRSGTWREFKQSLLTALSGTQHPELAGLATRADDDPSIALLDAVACVADVLTFYQERIANESYLRTSTERLSVLQLARLIGYELKPGAAAEAPIAFTADDAPGAPGTATVDVGLKVQSVPGHGEKAQTFETVEAIEARAEWNAMRPSLSAPQDLGMTSTEVWLAGTDTALRPGDAILLVGAERESNAGDEHWDLRRVARVVPDFDARRTRVVFGPGLGSHDPFSAPAAAPKVYALRTRAAIFGHNAPDWGSMSVEFTTVYKAAHPQVEPVTDWPAFKIYAPATTPSAASATVDLDAVYPSIVTGSWLALVKPDYAELYRVGAVASASRAEFGLSGKATRVTIEGENLDKFGAEVRATSVYAQSEELARSDAPITPPVTGLATAVLLDRNVGALPHGRTLLLAGRQGTGADVRETVVLDRSELAGGRTRLVFAAPLTHSYQLASLTIAGNVALATHGETVEEVLGGGNAARAYQEFTLRQPPTTYVRDSEASSGVRSTLAVRVNDLLWTEVPSFHGRGPGERVYVTRFDSEGKTVVQFGDGEHGARLPTGQENVRARYRKGTGLAGNVRDGQLSTLLTRPLGLKSGSNPAAATGGDDPEPRDAARENAPLTTLTLDRVVSLRDYEDFARAYAGIAKALATWSWDGQRRGVLITVAGPGGAPVESQVIDLLLGAIRKAGDPFVALRVATYRPAHFRVAYKVKTDPRHERARVHTATVDALRAGFGFTARRFGQGVALSDVIAAVQSVPGVVAVDVDSLTRTDGIGGSGLVNPLPAALPQAGALAASSAAELLLLAADPVVPGEMA
jgi:predicted phage baseplate assembly protein